jgi:hypothetical protein
MHCSCGSCLTLLKDTIVNDPATHGSVFVPIILGSDKTTVSVATGQNDFYPLYLSSGNCYRPTLIFPDFSLFFLTF